MEAGLVLIGLLRLAQSEFKSGDCLVEFVPVVVKIGAVVKLGGVGTGGDEAVMDRVWLGKVEGMLIDIGDVSVGAGPGVGIVVVVVLEYGDNIPAGLPPPTGISEFGSMTILDAAAA